MRMQGTVKVEFLWKENKTLADLKIIESSGYDLLDKSALESIRKASLNFPQYNGDLRITLPVIYDFKTLRGSNYNLLHSLIYNLCFLIFNFILKIFT